MLWYRVRRVLIDERQFAAEVVYGAIPASFWFPDLDRVNFKPLSVQYFTDER